MAVTVLPVPRKSRHPYQWCVCAGLLLLSASQLIVGPAPSSVAAPLPSEIVVWVNVQTIVACFLCLVATVVHDGWLRLWVELAGQVLAASVFGFYSLIIWQKVGIVNGLTIGIALAVPLALAAGIRAFQIGKTIRDYHRSIMLSSEQVQR